MSTPIRALEPPQPAPQPVPQPIPQSLRDEFDDAMQLISSKADWYKRKRNPKRYASSVLRAVAIIAFGVGTLLPLLQAVESIKMPPGVSELGYVLFALAAAFVAYDRFFGLSSGWIRYTLTWLELERMAQELKDEWTIFNAEWKGTVGSEEKAMLWLAKIKDFKSRVLSLVEKETRDWAVEFQTNYAEFEKNIKSYYDSRKPGDVSISIKNRSDFVSVTATIEDRPTQPVTGSTTLIKFIPPGRYEVKIEGTKKDGKQVQETRAIEISPGAMATLEVTL